MTAGFTGSVEFASLYTGMSAAQQVNQVYLNVLGRAAEPAALTYWGGVLTSGVSISALVSTIYNTVLAESATSTDYVTVANRVAYATQFTNAMSNSSPDILGYSGTVASNAARTALANAVPSSSTSTTTFPTLATDVTTVAGAGAAAAATAVNLTTSVDTITPAGPATINGVISSTVGYSTLNAFDSIKATGTGNTLNIVDQTTVGTLSTIPTITVSGVQTADIQSTTAESVNTSSWTGLTALNITASTASGAIADAVTAAGTTTVAVTETAGASTGTTTIDGGSTVSLTETANDGAAVTKLGGITIGGTTAPTGAVTVTDTVTLGAASSQGNITVTSAGPVTITSTVNDGVALIANAGAQTNGDAALITVSGAVGAVVVNDNTAITSKTTITTFADAVKVTGGSSVTVNEATTTTQAATGVSTITDGAVSVTGDATTTTVTVNQDAVATGALAVTTATAAITGVAAVSAVTAAPGVQGVAAVTAVNGGNSAAAVPVSAGTPTIAANGAVTIADAKNTSTATSTITTVNLNNFGATTFAGAALNSLALSGTGSTFAITNGAAAAATNTTLALAVNNLTGATLDDSAHNEIKTISVTTGATKSTLTTIKDSGLTTLNVAGASTLTLSTALVTNTANIATIAVTGAAGLTADVSGLGATLTSFTTTSSGVITAIVDDTTQTFKGSTGQDVISIAGDATKAITGGSATNNELVLTAVSTTYTAAKTGTNVTGFTTLGVNDGTAADANTYDMHGIFTGYNAIDLQSAMTGAQTFTGVAAGTSLAIDAAETSVSYVLFPASSTASVNVALNTTSTDTAITVATLTLNDSNADGVATLNVTSNAKDATQTGTTTINAITTLSDTGLSAINISGNAALQVGTISLGQPGQAVPVGVASFSITDNSSAFNNTGSAATASLIGSTSFTDDTLGTLTVSGTNAGGVTIFDLVDNNAVNLTINDNIAGGLTITTLSTDANANKVIHTGLSNLTFTGSDATTINTLTLVSNTAALNYTNSGTATDAIVALNDGTSLLTTTSLTLSGNIQLGTVGTTVAGDIPVAFADTAGVTIAAGTDNAHLSISLTGAAAAATDKVTVGNANNYIVDASTAGHVSVIVGTGSNYINLSGIDVNASYAATVTLGAHTATTGVDSVLVGHFASASGAAPLVAITGAVAGDIITFDATTAITSTYQVTAGQQTTINALTSVTAAIQNADGLAGTIAHAATVFQYGGNTYVIGSEAAGTGTLAIGDSVVELVGVHTLSSTVTSGHVVLAS